MQYIEVAKGLSIRVDEVEAVGYGVSELTSKVYTHHNVYDSTFPYRVLLKLLEKRDVRPEEKRSEEELNVFKQIGNLAG